MLAGCFRSNGETVFQCSPRRNSFLEARGRTPRRSSTFNCESLEERASEPRGCCKRASKSLAFPVNDHVDCRGSPASLERTLPINPLPFHSINGWFSFNGRLSCNWQTSKRLHAKERKTTSNGERDQPLNDRDTVCSLITGSAN